MNSTHLKLLRVGALILGWFLVAGVFAGVWGRIALYRGGLSDPTGIFGSMAAQFDIASSLSSFFSGFGNAFLAFLIAAVFLMIERQSPVGHENANRLMIVCCLSYVADALVRCCAFISSLSGVSHSHSAASFNLWFWLTYSSKAVPVLVPILYAASIFALYTHFTKMVTFESEVA